MLNGKIHVRIYDGNKRRTKKNRER